MGVRFVATIFGKFLYTFICTVVVKLKELHMHSFVAVHCIAVTTGGGGGEVQKG